MLNKHLLPTVETTPSMLVVLLPFYLKEVVLRSKHKSSSTW
jgi:hypothetical protein